MSKHLKDLNTIQPYLIQWTEFLHSCWFKPLWFLFKQILKLVRFRINFLKLDIRSRMERKTARILKKTGSFLTYGEFEYTNVKHVKHITWIKRVIIFQFMLYKYFQKWLLIQKKITFLSNTWFRFILHFFKSWLRNWI